MTLEEANQIAKIVDEADGGCPYCAGALRHQLEKQFPQFIFGNQGDTVKETES